MVWCALALAVPIAAVEPPALAWNVTLGGSDGDAASAVQQTSDGGIIVAGYTDSNDGDVVGYHGGVDAWVVKLDAAGQIAWTRALGGSGDDYASAVQQTSDGGYVVAGSTDSNDGDVGLNHGLEDMWVVKLMAESAPAVLAVPGGTGLPKDANADGKYDDVNGNGRIDFADVVWLFNNL